MKSLLWTAAEAGLGFYNGHKGSDAVRGTADIRGGEQGQQQRQTTDRYTRTPEFAPPMKYFWSKIDKVEVRKVGGRVGGYRTNQFPQSGRGRFQGDMCADRKISILESTNGQRMNLHYKSQFT